MTDQDYAARVRTLPNPYDEGSTSTSEAMLAVGFEKCRAAVLAILAAPAPSEPGLREALVAGVLTDLDYMAEDEGGALTQRDRTIADAAVRTALVRLAAPAPSEPRADHPYSRTGFDGTCCDLSPALHDSVRGNGDAPASGHRHDDREDGRCRSCVRYGASVVDEALNSGDGIYRP